MTTFVTDPATFLQAYRWYKVNDLATLFGVTAARIEAILGAAGPERVQGGQVLTWLSRMGDVGCHQYIDPSGIMLDSVAAFQASYPDIA